MLTVKIRLNSVRVKQGSFILAADAEFLQGIHLVTGPVGAGKSTLALIIAGCCRPDQGIVTGTGIGSTMISFQFPEIHVNGATIAKECRSWGCDIGILKEAGLDGCEERSPYSLSRGELKRLILSCVLAGVYDLLLLDEPFSSLDCAGKDMYCRLLSKRGQGGITILFTHEQSFFPRVDYLWELRGGQLIFLGAVPDAIRRWTFAPPWIRECIARGHVPENLTRDDILEAACRI
jgi:energy-coupling factor transport system ATP-binding protein